MYSVYSKPVDTSTMTPAEKQAHDELIKQRLRDFDNNNGGSYGCDPREWQKGLQQEVARQHNF